MIQSNSSDRQVILTAQMPSDTKILPFIQQKKWLKGKPSWSIFYLDMVEELAADKDLTVTDLRVFLGLLKHMDFDNIVDVSQQILSDRLDIGQSKISLSIKKLINKGYLEIFGQKGKRNIYRLNPYVVYRGTGSGLEELEQEFVPIKRKLD